MLTLRPRALLVQWTSRTGLCWKMHDASWLEGQFHVVGTADQQPFPVQLKAGVQVVQDMAFVAVHAHAAPLAPVTHLGIFDAHASIFGHGLAQLCRPRLRHLYILLFHPLCCRHALLDRWGLT